MNPTDIWEALLILDNIFDEYWDFQSVFFLVANMMASLSNSLEDFIFFPVRMLYFRDMQRSERPHHMG